MSWHSQVLQKLGDRAALHHGMMLCGEPGIGKREFSVSLARMLLCQHSDPLTCAGACQSCGLFNSGSHPDLHVLCSEREAVAGRIPLLADYSVRYQDVAARERKANPSVIIPVDQVRLLTERFVQSSYISEYRVALIIAADRMNASAANALLKLLEEPPQDSFLVLVTADPELLPATVRSRTLTLNLAEPTDQQALQWLADSGHTGLSRQQLDQALAEASGGPLDVATALTSGDLDRRRDNVSALLQMLRGQQQPIALAASLAKQDVLPLLEWLQQVAIDLIRWQSSAREPAWLAAAGDPVPDIQSVSPAALFALYAKLSKSRYIARDQLNAQLALEDILIGIWQLFRAPKPES